MSKSSKLPNTIVIYDPSVIRKVVEEQTKEGDKKPTRTIAKMIDRYCESRPPNFLHPFNTSNPQRVQKYFHLHELWDDHGKEERIHGR